MKAKINEQIRKRWSGNLPNSETDQVAGKCPQDDWFILVQISRFALQSRRSEVSDKMDE